MQKLLMFVLWLTAVTWLVGADAVEKDVVLKIPAAEAKDNVGKMLIVSGVVADIHRTDKVVRLNFGAAFPKQTFTAVVFSERTNAFSNLDALKGKTVEVSGKVEIYKGHPEIILRSKGQLVVVEEKKEEKDNK